jgi:hypothetical protein
VAEKHDCQISSDQVYIQSQHDPSNCMLVITMLMDAITIHQSDKNGVAKSVTACSAMQ